MGTGDGQGTSRQDQDDGHGPDDMSSGWATMWDATALEEVVRDRQAPRRATPADRGSVAAP